MVDRRRKAAADADAAAGAARSWFVSHPLLVLLWFGGADNKMTWPRAVLGDVAVDKAKRAARAKLFYNRGLPENETSSIDHQCKISLLNPVLVE